MRKNIQGLAYNGIQTIGQSYHSTSDYEINYAFQGFNKNLYFTSDRTIELDDNFKIKSNPDKALKGFGLELELASFDISSNEGFTQVLEKICTEGLPSNLFKYQNDCTTTNAGGFTGKEAITQVMTKEFVRNNYPGFKLMFDYFRMFGIKATTSCGMHCNMSVGLFGTNKKTREEAIRKFVYFINSKYKLSCGLVKRGVAYTDYCGKMYRWADKTYAQNYNFDTLSEGQSDHGICFNIAHYPTGRVELRLVGNQVSYASFRNTMEVIFHLVEAVKTKSWQQMDDVKEVFKGCNKYVLSRLNDCFADDLITRADYDVIKENVDNSVDFGRY